MLPRVVVVDVDMLRACPIARIATNGLSTVGIGEDRRRARPKESQLTEKITKENGSALMSPATTYSNSGVEHATVEMVTW